MPRYEVRFYDAQERVKIAVELDAADRPAAEAAARSYLGAECAARIGDQHLILGVVRELG